MKGGGRILGRIADAATGANRDKKQEKKREKNDGKRQVLGLNLSVYHINERLCSAEPGDNNQLRGLQIRLLFFARSNHLDHSTVSQPGLHTCVCLVNVPCFISSPLTDSIKGWRAFLCFINGHQCYSLILLVTLRTNQCELDVYVFLAFDKIPVS